MLDPAALGFELAGSIDNQSETGAIVNLTGGPFQYVLVVDRSQTPDGFDIDAVAVHPVPEPGTVLLLGAGLVALVGIGRKKFGK